VDRGGTVIWKGAPAAECRIGWRLLVSLLLLVPVGCQQLPDGGDGRTTMVVLYPETGVRAFLDQEGPFVFLLPLVGLTDSGRLEGRLAQRWEHSPDRRTWTIWLRPDVRWHDGVPVTAHDVKFTVDLKHHPAIADLSHIEDVTVVDDTTLVMRFSGVRPFESWWLPGAWNAFLPKHLLENEDPAEFDRWEYWEHPVGNGPYRWVSHQPGTQLELEANSDYYRGKPAIDRLIIRFGSLGFTELLAGEVDAINFASSNEVQVLAGDSRFRLYREVWDDVAALQCIFWNHGNPLFRDVRVRRALTLAIDRADLKNAMFMWSGLPVIDGLVSPRQYWNEELPPPFPYDPSEASRLLDEAGWRDGDGDGVREKDGRPFEFTVLALRNVGVRMNVLLLDNSVVRERLASGDFDAVIEYLWAEPGSGIHSLDALLGEESSTGYRNPRVAELIDQLEQTLDPDVIDPIYAELSEIIRTDVPMTYLTMNVETYVAHRRIKGLSTPFRANPVWNAEHLWIEETE
jgi:peptide/nickel transport system substrate-binding protein